MSDQTTITATQISLVKETWTKVVPIADAAANLFYSRLFEINPQLAPMFAGADMPQQRKKLVKAINLVVISLEQFETLVPMISEMGQRHVSYGVEDAHYDQVGAALLWTLQTGLEDGWSDEAEQAWAMAYQLLANTMITGANEVKLSAA